MRQERKFLYGVFDDQDDIMNAVKNVRLTSSPILDCFTPYAVHGLDREMGLKRSRLALVAFLCGMTGFFLAVTFQWYTMVHDWPMNIGGKPSQVDVPSFVPVCFEFTVLSTAFGMAITFFLRAGIVHGVRATILEPNASDDKFVLCFDLEDAEVNPVEVAEIMKNNGAIKVEEKHVLAKPR